VVVVEEAEVVAEVVAREAVAELGAVAEAEARRVPMQSARMCAWSRRTEAP
jgi:hypothetical protein